jgi:hypothetical protein
MIYWVAIPFQTREQAESCVAEIDDRLGYHSEAVPTTETMIRLYDRAAHDRAVNARKEELGE